METSPLAGQTVKIRENVSYLGGESYRVEDYWINVAGKSWMECNGNPACLNYAMRSTKLPIDNNVLYGKIGDFGHLVHISEIEN